MHSATWGGGRDRGRLDPNAPRVEAYALDPRRSFLTNPPSEVPMSGWSPLSMFPAVPLAWIAGARLYSPAKGGGTSRTPPGEETFATFFGSSEDPMVILDPTLRVASANPAAARFLETPAERLRG